MSIWDDPNLKAASDFVKFDAVGDGVAGTITAIRSHTFDDGKTVPQIFITTDSGDERTLSAGQTKLKLELATQRPEVGDHLTVRLTQIERRAGGKTLKHFDVQVRRGSNAATPAAASAGAPPF